MKSLKSKLIDLQSKLLNNGRSILIIIVIVILLVVITIIIVALVLYLYPTTTTATTKPPGYNQKPTDSDQGIWDFFLICDFFWDFSFYFLVCISRIS